MHLNPVVFTFLIFSLVATSTLQAKPNKPVPSAKTPVVEEVQVNFADSINCQVDGASPSPLETVTIMGFDFSLSDDPAPVITLGTYPPLKVCVFDEELVVAELPPATEDGDYLL